MSRRPVERRSAIRGPGVALPACTALARRAVRTPRERSDAAGCLRPGALSPATPAEGPGAHRDLPSPRPWAAQAGTVHGRQIEEAALAPDTDDGRRGILKWSLQKG